jgi:hypothetical protein
MKNTVVNAAKYSITIPEKTIENGAIRRPEREGKLIPQTRSNRNKTVRCFNIYASLLINQSVSI